MLKSNHNQIIFKSHHIQIIFTASDYDKLILKKLELIHEVKSPADSTNAYELLTSNRGQRLMLSLFSYKISIKDTY